MCSYFVTIPLRTLTKGVFVTQRPKRIARLVRTNSAHDSRLLNNLHEGIPVEQLVMLARNHGTDLRLEIFFELHPDLKEQVDHVLSRD